MNELIDCGYDSAQTALLATQSPDLHAQLAMPSTPNSSRPDIATVRAYLASVDGVSEVHDLHIWDLSTTETALTAHLIFPGGFPSDGKRHEICSELKEHFPIGHSTIQIETGDAGQTCELAPITWCSLRRPWRRLQRRRHNWPATCWRRPKFDHLNLAVNARDAMPGGGKLTVETMNTHLDDAYARQHVDLAPGQYVMVAVSDTGSGMPPEVAERAFEPFFTTKGVGEGTGLGLSQVYGFVKQSGGHVKIYSEMGQGTTVKIYLRRELVERAVAGTDDEAETRAPAGSVREIILVVEDEAQVRTVSVAALRDLGYTVRHAASGAEALQVLDGLSHVALLFTDVVMPGMSGRQLADAACARQPGLKVLYTTGYTPNAIVHSGVVDVGVELLPKPFTVDQLARKVRKVLG